MLLGHKNDAIKKIRPTPSRGPMRRKFTNKKHHPENQGDANIIVSVKYRPRIFKFPGLCDNPPDVRN